MDNWVINGLKNSWDTFGEIGQAFKLITLPTLIALIINTVIIFEFPHGIVGTALKIMEALSITFLANLLALALHHLAFKQMIASNKRISPSKAWFLFVVISNLGIWSYIYLIGN